MRVRGWDEGYWLEYSEVLLPKVLHKRLNVMKGVSYKREPAAFSQNFLLNCLNIHERKSIIDQKHHTSANAIAIFELNIMFLKVIFVLLCSLCYRVDRVLFFSPVVRIGTPTACDCVLHPLVQGEDTRLRERVWGVPIQTRRQTLWCSRYIYTVACKCSQIGLGQGF